MLFGGEGHNVRAIQSCVEASKQGTATEQLEKEWCFEKVKSVKLFLGKRGIWRRVEVGQQGNDKYMRR